MPLNEAELRREARMRNRLQMMDAERLSKGSHFLFNWTVAFIVASFIAMIALAVFGWEA